MQPSLANSRMLHSCEQHGMREELTISDHQINASDVHVHDAAGANIEMSNLAVAHLSLGQADEGSAGMNERVGIFAQQPVVSRLACERDGVSFCFGAITPAVEDDQDEWFRTGHRCGF